MASSLQSLTQWAGQQLGDQSVTLQPLYGDASRRCYFRVKSDAKTYILGDASAEITSVPAFVDIAVMLREQGISVPKIYASDLVHGYVLEDDLGDTTLLSVLNTDNVDPYYHAASSIILKMQTCDLAAHQTLPHYDKTLLQREWTVFTTWFLENYYQVSLTDHTTMLERCVQIFYDIFSEQPQVFVHRDFHSRNLMVTDSCEPLAVIDFQGAVIGPITYDAVSLFKGCYIDWAPEKVQQWALGLKQKMWQQIGAPPVSDAQYLRWFDLTGLQRHLKVLGQFCRQAMAEKNESYLPDMPRVLSYVMSTCEQYPEFHDLHQLLKSIV